MQDWSLKQALEFVSQQRPQISPNSGFMARLIRLEESLHGTKTVKVRLLQSKVIALRGAADCHACHRQPCVTRMSTVCLISSPAATAHMLGKACMLTGVSHCAAVQEYQAGATNVPCVRRERGHLMAVSGSARAQQAWSRA